MLCAIVNNNVVTSVQTLSTSDGSYQLAAASAQVVIDITNMTPQPQVGWTLNGNTLVSNGNNLMQITKLAFRERFTTTELLAIYAAIPTYPLVQIMLDNQAVATFVDLNRTDTQSGVYYLASIGCITMARATAILTTPPTSTEAYIA